MRLDAALGSDAAVAFLVALAVTGATIAYARRRGLLDQPGRRRSHRIPTPRGGGIGLVAGVLAGVGALLLCNAGATMTGALGAASAAAVMLVAGVGWLDDHRSLPVRPRLVVQVLAVALFLLAWQHTWGRSGWWLPGLLVLGVWSINLHNFMDGIDGLLGMQLAVTGAALAILAGVDGRLDVAAGALAMTAAAAGFLVFNLAPARIFMGDVGSGTAGLLVFILAALWFGPSLRGFWPAIMLHAGFAIDAGLTLGWRMLRGRRWYAAHREHLYQRMVRCGWTHAQTGSLYMIFNLAVAVPLSGFAYMRPGAAPALCVILYLIAAALWWQGRRVCLRRVRTRGGRGRA